MSFQSSKSSQVPTTRTTTQSIMRAAAFAAGVDDVRNGRAPNFDSYADDWAYERGRLFASVAPTSMPLLINGKLNPRAVALAVAAFERRLII
jgi:hypothetical protein